MDINDIQAIVQILKQNEITDFELEHNGTHLKVSRGHAITSVVTQAVAAPRIEPAINPTVAHTNGAAVNGHPVNSDASPGAIPSHLKKVESPIVGTFYRKPSPDAPQFAKEGDRVKKGQTLCIVEAMKVMNEIESPFDGVLEKIMPNDGEVVEFGEVLFLVNPQG